MLECSLQVVVHEWEGNGYATRLRAWLDLRWGEAVIPQAGPAPELPEIVQRPPGRPYTTPNKWAREQFDAGKSKPEILARYSQLYDALEPRPQKPPRQALDGVYSRWLKQRAKKPNN